METLQKRRRDESWGRCNGGWDGKQSIPSISTVRQASSLLSPTLLPHPTLSLSLSLDHRTFRNKNTNAQQRSYLSLLLLSGLNLQIELLTHATIASSCIFTRSTFFDPSREAERSNGEKKMTTQRSSNHE